MKQTIKYLLVCLGFVTSHHAFSLTEHILQQGYTYEVALESNDPQVFPNVFMWSIKGKCTIISDEENNFLTVKALKRSGTVNGIKLSEGHSLKLIVHPNEVIRITVEPNAKAEITNTGGVAFKATCVSES